MHTYCCIMLILCIYVNSLSPICLCIARVCRFLSVCRCLSVSLSVHSLPLSLSRRERKFSRKDRWGKILEHDTWWHRQRRYRSWMLQTTCHDGKMIQLLWNDHKARISERDHCRKTKSSVKIQAKFDYILKTVLSSIELGCSILAVTWLRHDSNI